MRNDMFLPSLTIAVSAVLSVGSPAAKANQLVNPGFETPDAAFADTPGVTGWTEFGEPNTRFVTQRTPPHSGFQCLKMFGPWVQWAGTGMTQTYPAVEGQTWVAEIWSYNDSRDPMGAGNFCVIKIEFLDSLHQPAGGAWLAGVNVFEVRVADENTPRDIWQLFGVGTAPAPAGTAFANFVIVEVQGHVPPSGGSVFLDDASFDLDVPPDPCAAHNPVFDTNDDQHVDGRDLEAFTACMTGPAILLSPDATQECKCMDRNHDEAVDQQDFGMFQLCFSGMELLVDAACDD